MSFQNGRIDFLSFPDRFHKIQQVYRIQRFEWAYLICRVHGCVILDFLDQCILNVIEDFITVCSRVNDSSIFAIENYAPARAFRLITVAAPAFPSTGSVIWKVIGYGLRVWSFPVILKLKTASS